MNGNPVILKNLGQPILSIHSPTLSPGSAPFLYSLRIVLTAFTTPGHLGGSFGINGIANLEKVEDKILGLVTEYAGKKRFKPIDIVKEMEKEFASEALTKDDIKGALKDLMDDEKLVYGYAGGSFLTLPENK